MVLFATTSGQLLTGQPPQSPCTVTLPPSEILEYSSRLLSWDEWGEKARLRALTGCPRYGCLLLAAFYLLTLAEHPLETGGERR